MISKEADDILRKARKLIEDPKRWVKQRFAEDAEGYECLGHSPRAVCWCAWGAINCVSELGTPHNMEAKEALDRASYAIFQKTSVEVNDLDTTSHADVLLMFSAARWQ